MVPLDKPAQASDAGKVCIQQGDKRTSLSKSSGTVLLEMIKNQSVDRGKFLQTSHLPGALHLARFSSNWFV